VRLETRKLSGEKVDMGEELAIMNEYADICLIAVCNDFFQAETQLLDMINVLCEEVFSGLEVDMGFL
jgi:hypothetical protein